MNILGIETHINERGMIHVNPFVKHHNEKGNTKKNMSSFFVTDSTKDFIKDYKRLYKSIYGVNLEDRDIYMTNPKKGTHMCPTLFAKAYQWICKEYDPQEFYEFCLENSKTNELADQMNRNILDHFFFIENFDPLFFLKEANLISIPALYDSNAAYLNSCMLVSGIDINTRYCVLKKYFNIK